MVHVEPVTPSLARTGTLHQESQWAVDPSLPLGHVPPPQPAQAFGHPAASRDFYSIGPLCLAGPPPAPGTARNAIGRPTHLELSRYLCNAAPSNKNPVVRGSPFDVQLL